MSQIFIRCSNLGDKIGVKKYTPTSSFTQHASGVYRQSIPLSSFALPDGAIPMCVNYTRVTNPNTAIAVGFDADTQGQIRPDRVYMMSNSPFTGVVELQVVYYMP